MKFVSALISALCILVLALASSEQAIQAGLTPGQSLTNGQCTYSPSGNYRLCLTNGELHSTMKDWCWYTFYNWSSPQDGTYDSICGSPGLGTHANQSASGTVNATADMQGDGNFVLYTGSGGSAVWQSNTAASPSTSSVEIQDDGNLVVYHNGSPVWSVW
jgi:hypothetical protein